MPPLLLFIWTNGGKFYLEFSSRRLFALKVPCGCTDKVLLSLEDSMALFPAGFTESNLELVPSISCPELTFCLASKASSSAALIDLLLGFT